MASYSYNGRGTDGTVERPPKQSKRKSIVASFRNFFKKQFSTEPIDITDSVPSFDPAASNKQDVVWMQACYNAAAMVFVFIAGCVVLVVYYFVEPFLHPLLWAVIVGMVLHPFKHFCTSKITQWLHYIQKSGMSLSLGTVLIPLFVFNWLSAKMENVVVGNVWMIAKLTVGVLICLVSYVLNFPFYMYWLLQGLYQILDGVSVIPSVSLYITLGSLLLGFMILTVTKDLTDSFILIFVSSILWFVVLLNVSFQLLGRLAVPPTFCLFLVATFLSLVWKRGPPTQDECIRPESGVEDLSHRTEKEHVSTSMSGICHEGESSSVSLMARDKAHITVITTDSRGEEECETLSITSGTISTSVGAIKESTGKKKSMLSRRVSASNILTFAGTETASGEETSFGDGKFVSSTNMESFPPKTRSSLCVASEDIGTSVTPATMPSKVTATLHVKRTGHQRSRYACRSAQSALMAQKSNNYAFVVLIIACCLVFIWKHPLIMFLIAPLFLSVTLGKFFYLYVYPRIQLQLAIRDVTSRISLLFRGKMQLFFPPSIATLGRMFLFLDDMVLKLTIQSVGVIVSACIIVGLFVGLGTAAVLLVLQIRVELMHYVTVSAVVWNKTMEASPHFVEWLNSSQYLTHSLEDIAHQGYESGRDFLVKQIHSMVVSSSANTSLVEKQVLDIFDKVYYSYFVKEGARPSPLFKLHVEEETAADSMGALFAEVKFIILNNLETIFSVLKSVGTLITENLSVTLSFFYALLQVLFSGGTALINLVIFMSTLFSLLNASDEQYLAIRWVLDLAPQLSSLKFSASNDGEGEGDQGGNEQAEAFQRAIRSVFYASFRRASFYGLYIWLIHNIMGISVSVLPAVLAAIDGAIPFLGVYWVAIPAILELWLIDAQPLLAATMFLLSLLPTFFIESHINGEIQGGHQYLTGLAIAGGIYIAGLEGALIGPILLCCLIFFVDVYEDIFNN